ncbi:MAG TPA: hypothetical protein VMI72_03380 [Roseiarcus sp.]|nr:hypothetical protein [Roseiarcus sp.]
MNWTLPVGFVLFLVGAALGLAQLWLCLWGPETFFKLMTTVGVLLAIVLAWDLVLRETRDAEKLESRRELD